MVVQVFVPNNFTSNINIDRLFQEINSFMGIMNDEKECNNRPTI